jgi:hypothetical protein
MPSVAASPASNEYLMVKVGEPTMCVTPPLRWRGPRRQLRPGIPCEASDEPRGEKRGERASVRMPLTPRRVKS